MSPDQVSNLFQEFTQADGSTTRKYGGTGLEMIEQAHQEGRPYQLLMLDWVMLEMDGAHVLQTLRECYPNNVPLPIILSAYDSDVMHDTAALLNANLFLAKPVLPEALRHPLNGLTGNVPVAGLASIDLPEQPSLDGMRVLLVEDNVLNQQLATELMLIHGVEIVVAAHGQEAVNGLEAPPDGNLHLVLMDLHMPVMNGLPS